MPTRQLPPTQSGPVRPPGKRPRRPAEPRAAVVPPRVRPEAAPGIPGHRWKTRTNQWPSVRGVGARHPPATSTPPTRPAGRAGAPGPTAIQTSAPSRRAKAAGIHAPAAIPTSGLTRDRFLAAAGSRATTGMSRRGRQGISVATSPMSRTNPASPPTRLRGVVAQPRAGQTAPIRHTTRSRRSATAGKCPSTSREPSRAPNAGVDHGRHAGPRPNPGSTTSKS